MADIMEVFRSTGGLRGVKRDLYEGGIRTPFVAKWPGNIRPGTESNLLATFWDVLPTLAEISGTETPLNVDGISFYKDLFGKKQKTAKPLYWEFNEGGFKQAVRLGDWKAIRFYKRGKPQRTELYDIVKDPAEKTDLAPYNRSKVHELEFWMDKEHLPAENSYFKIN
jgi:arylsulfatase A-like enzyme